MSTGDGSPPRPEEAPLELELADVPRRRQRIATLDPPGTGATTSPLDGPGPALPPPGRSATLPPPSSAAARAPLPPIHGRAVLDDPSPWWGRAFWAVIAAVALYVGYWGYQRWFTPNVRTIGATYKSWTGVVVDMPSPGWKADKRHRFKRTSGDNWIRGEVMYRGATPETADEFALVVRFHAAGAFGQTVSNAMIETAFRQGAAGSGVEVSDLNCVTERSWRAEAGTVCYARAARPEGTLAGGLYLWMVGNDDLVGIAYGRTQGSLEALERMVRSAR